MPLPVPEGCPDGTRRQIGIDARRERPCLPERSITSLFLPGGSLQRKLWELELAASQPALGGLTRYNWLPQAEKVVAGALPRPEGATQAPRPATVGGERPGGGPACAAGTLALPQRRFHSPVVLLPRSTPQDQLAALSRAVPSAPRAACLLRAAGAGAK